MTSEKASQAIKVAILAVMFSMAAALVIIASRCPLHPPSGTPGTIRVVVRNDSLYVLTSAPPTAAARAILNGLAQQSNSVIARAINVADSLAAENARLKNSIARLMMEKEEMR